MQRSFFIFLIALFYCSASGHADTTHLKIATTHIPPYIIHQDNGAVTGIAIELVKETAKKCHITPRFTLLAWARAMQESEHGHTDAIMPFAKVTGRENTFIFPETPLLTFEMTLFSRKNDMPDFGGSISNLSGLTIGTLRNTIVSEAFSNAEKNGIFNHTKRDTYKALALGLSRNRLDAFAAEKQMGLWAIAELSLQSSLTPVPHTLGTLPVYLAFVKATTKPKTALQFDTCFQEVLKEGKLKELVAKYDQPPKHMANEAVTPYSKQ